MSLVRIVFLRQKTLIYALYYIVAADMCQGKEKEVVGFPAGVFFCGGLCFFSCNLGNIVYNGDVS